MLSASGELKELLIERVKNKRGNYLLAYQNSMFSDELLNSIFKHDVYELPLERNIQLITDKWAEFAEKAMQENKTYIFECCFIQNPITVAMVKYGAQKEIVLDYVMELASIIEPLNPQLFYIVQDDLEFSFKKAIMERPKEWSSGFIEYYTNQGYGKEMGYQGIDGTLKVLKKRRAIENDIFDLLKMNKEKVNNSQCKKEKYKTLLMEKLK